MAHDSNLGTVRLSPGGVGRNIAHNLALLGVDVRLVTCFGEDAQADALVESCAEAGIDIAHSFVVPGAATSTYLYVTDESGEMQVAINDMAILEHLTPSASPSADLLNQAAAVVVDTNLPRDDHCAGWPSTVTAPLFCDPISTAKAQRSRARGAPPHAQAQPLEAEALSGVGIHDEWSLARARSSCLATGLERAFVSLGAEGLLCADRHRSVRLPLARARWSTPPARATP